MHALCTLTKTLHSWYTLENSLPFASFAPVLRSPLNALWIDSQFPLCHRPRMTIQNFLCQANDVLSLVVLHQLQILKG